ncbi:hypothetical protein Ddye_003781 [Dipteronia dyeriana]|uniref:Uncharacterized protein n=1 Tax=Dipteronia dyeriana TaxID=168575 RepID=A0AAD9XU46_9ROSI|nr:hypothetical protein Ddye_003781 [Dipteronia dyeriana]
MIAAILKISSAALHVEDKAPPPFLLPFEDGALSELTIFANDCSVHTGTPSEVTPFSAFRPPNVLSPADDMLWFTFMVFLDFVAVDAATVNVAGESVADAVAIILICTHNLNKSKIYIYIYKKAQKFEREIISCCKRSD